MGLGKEQQPVNCEMNNSQSLHRAGRHFSSTSQNGKTTVNTQGI